MTDSDRDLESSSSESESMVDLNKTVSRTSDRALAGPRVLPISKFNLKFKCISLSQVSGLGHGSKIKMREISKFDGRSMQKQRNDCQRHSEASTRIKSFR